MTENGHFLQPKNDMVVVGFESLLASMTENGHFLQPKNYMLGPGLDF
jgi:hypothetical protein